MGFTAILAMIPMLVGQFANQERSFIRPMAIAHVTSECARIGVSKTADEIGAGVDFCLDIAIGEQTHIANAIASVGSKPAVAVVAPAFVTVTAVSK